MYPCPPLHFFSGDQEEEEGGALPPPPILFLAPFFCMDFASCIFICALADHRKNLLQRVGAYNPRTYPVYLKYILVLSIKNTLTGLFCSLRIFELNIPHDLAYSSGLFF